MRIPAGFRRLPLVLPLALWLAAPLAGSAQTDNFDTGTLDPAWKTSNFNPALVNTSFPDSGNGKAFRIQASPVPDTAPAAAMFYRDEVYTDFYMAVDVVDWPGTDMNQAIVLIARATLSGNPAETTGIILNYDASQYGENPNDRRQGQFQINMVTNDPPFGTKTLAVAEITLEPGRPYRFVFEGVGSHYTGQVYDHQDLTRPLVTIEADDAIQGSQPGGDVFFESGFTSGVCGVLSFSREGTTGATDVTLDNYFAGAANPNPAPAPALAHPVPGTPAVETRVPAERFKNFHDPSAGLSFTASTYPDELINAGATKLRLNGSDVSGQLVLPEDGATINVSLPGSALAANRVYSAQIEVEDLSGTKKSTNTFWFDTFSDAYLRSQEVKTIEAEEYNYNGGEFQADPIPVSGLSTNFVPVNGSGIGYWEVMGFEGIDFHDNRTSAEGPWFSEFRTFDAVGLSAGIYPEITDLNETEAAPVRRGDHIRSQYAEQELLEYVVHRTEPGEWLNYTREFEPRSYAAYLRVASFGETEVELREVTSDPRNIDQTSEKLGTFEIPNLITRYNYRYVPLLNDQGGNAILDLSGEQTLRLQMAGTTGQDARKIAMNYILLVPQAAASVQLLGAAAVTGPYAEETGATVDAEARTITVPSAGSMRFYQIRADSEHRITATQVSEGSVVLSYE